MFVSVAGLFVVWLFVSCDMVYLISDVECVTTIRARVHCRNTIAYVTVQNVIVCRMLILSQNSNRMSHGLRTNLTVEDRCEEG